MQRNRGFTLSEMLIVVAILAIMIAVAIPLFSSTLEKAREAKDLANLRAAVSMLQSASIENSIPHKINKGLIAGQVYYDRYSTDGSEYYFMYVIAEQKKWGWQSNKDNAKTNIGGTSTSASIYGWNARIRLNTDSIGEVIITGLSEDGGKKVRAANGVE